MLYQIVAELEFIKHNNMRDTLVGIGMILALISVVAFLVGIIMVFIERYRKLALRILLGSVIAFIIGFSTCAYNFNLH